MQRQGQIWIRIFPDKPITRKPADVRMGKGKGCLLYTSHLMYDGKKNTSYEIFYAALETVKLKLPNEEKSALEIWKKALDNVTPQVEVKSRRVRCV